MRLTSGIQGDFRLFPNQRSSIRFDGASLYSVVHNNLYRALLSGELDAVENEGFKAGRLPKLDGV
jgi:hypothetical protein